MAVPTISGIIKRVDDTPYVGKLNFYRMAPAMFNGTSLVVLSQLVITTDSSGEFSTDLQPGIYEVETCVSKYPGVPWSRVRVRVPNSSDEINFSDLERESSLPDPSFFGGSSGSGGSVDVATTTTAGIVKISETDGDPVAVTIKTLTGTAAQPVVFCPLSGRLFLYVTSSGLYHEQLAFTDSGVTSAILDQTGVLFADLPA